jgi:spore germination protein KB
MPFFKRNASGKNKQNEDQQNSEEKLSSSLTENPEKIKQKTGKSSDVNIRLFKVSEGSLGVGLFSRTQFPLLRTIQTIDIANFIERLDVVYMFILSIGSFMCTAIFFYARVSGTVSLFNIKDPSQLCYPLGIVVLFLSHIIASDLQEYLVEGQKLQFIIHLPFQVIIPLLLFIIAFWKNRKINI